MKTVIRYDFLLSKSMGGDYVLYTDYQELQNKIYEVADSGIKLLNTRAEEINALQAKLDKAIEALQRYKEISIDVKEGFFTTSEYVASNTLAELTKGDV